MSVDFSNMTDRELRQYILAHRQNDEAFYAYMDRRAARPNRELISLDTLEEQNKLDAAIRRQINDGFPPKKVGARNLNYDRYKGYAIAIQKIDSVNQPWKYLAKPLMLEQRESDLQWEFGQVEVYGKNINDAIKKCKEEIDKLLARTGGGKQ